MRFDRFFRNPETGELVIAQTPNAPLIVFVVAAVVRTVFQPAGTTGTVISAVGTVSLVVWAGLEIGWGHSPFRRVLGAVVLAGVVVGLLLR